MDREIMELLLGGLHILLVNVTAIGIGIFTENALFRRKRSILWVVCYFIGYKSILINIIVSLVMRHFYGAEAWWDFFYAFLSILTAILNYVVFCWTFDDSFLKIAVGCMFADVTGASFMAVGLVFINHVENQPSAYNFYLPVQLMDLWMPVIAVGIYSIFYFIAGAQLKKFRDYQFRHEKAWWCFFIGYSIYALTTVLPSWSSDYTSIYVMFFSSFALLFTVGIFIFRSHNKKLRMAHSYLTVRRRLMESSYQTMTGQIRQMEQSRRVIERQMEQIQQMGTENIESERIRSYLQELQERYDNISVGIYCDDWEVDALLCYQESLCRKHGIETDFYLQEFHRGSVSVEDMQQLLLLLLDHGRKRVERKPDGGGKISLHIGTVKNQMVVEYETEAGGKQRLLKRQLFPIVKKYDGTLKIETEKKDAGKMKAVLVLQAGRPDTGTAGYTGTSGTMLGRLNKKLEDYQAPLFLTQFNDGYSIFHLVICILIIEFKVCIL